MTDNCTPLSVTDLSIACDLVMSACKLLDRYDSLSLDMRFNNLDKLNRVDIFQKLIKSTRSDLRTELSRLELLKDIEGELR